VTRQPPLAIAFDQFHLGAGAVLDGHPVQGGGVEGDQGFVGLHGAKATAADEQEGGQGELRQEQGGEQPKGLAHDGLWFGRRRWRRGGAASHR
jgi:hypothetical protein